VAGQAFEFLFFGFYSAVELLDVLGGWEVFGADATFSQHFAHASVVLDVLGGYGRLAAEVFFVHVVVGHFRGEVLLEV